MEFKFFGEQGPEEKIEALKQEEREGLRKFYTEIVTPDILARNNKNWESHLLEHLKLKYPDMGSQEFAIRKAERYAERMPLRHDTNYQALKSSTLSHIASNFMVRELGQYRDTGSTGGFDVAHELDHFVYCGLGVREPGAKDRPKQWNTQVYIRNGILKEEGTIVALEDFGWGTLPRLMPQAYKGNTTSSGPHDAFEVHLQQIWTGQDFKRLFPMMLAYAYENPADFEDEKPFPLDITPEGLPFLTKSVVQNEEHKSVAMGDFPRFEIRIPSSIVPSDVLLVCVDSSAVPDQAYVEDKVAVVPSHLSRADKLNFIKDRLRETV